MFAPTGEVCNAGSRVGAKKKGEEAWSGGERERERHQETKVGREDVGSEEGTKGKRGVNLMRRGPG